MGISDKVSINMKTLLALLPLFALALAQEPEACAVCRKGVDVLMKELNSKDSLAMQEQLLIEEGCKKAEDPEGCAEAVKTWWARMAKAVYTDKTSAALCAPSPKKWDCKTCVEDLKKVSAVMDSKEAGAALAKLLSGEAFCKAEDLALDEEQIKECVAQVEKQGVMGFQYIFKLVGEYSKDVCTKLYEVCKPGLF